MANRSFHNCLITCEHAGNRVPESYRHLFSDAEDILKSHRGWDPGAIRAAEIIAAKLGAPLIDYSWTRLLIEPNRSPGHRKLFSKFTQILPAVEKKKLIAQYYLPHRNRVETRLKAMMLNGKTAVHISVHTFTPELNGDIRSADAGLLYDPSRRKEKEFCRDLKKQLQLLNPGFRVRMNYPYLGTADGFTTALRKKFPADRYLGIELEINQKWLDPEKKQWTEISNLFAASLRNVLSAIDS